MVITMTEERNREMENIPNSYLAIMREHLEVTRKGLSEVKEEISSLRTLFAAWMPELVKKYQFTITDVITEINESNMPTMPWISVGMDNVGAADVHMYINEYGVALCDVAGAIEEDIIITAGGGLGADFLDSRIKKVFLVCDPGDTTTVEIYATCKYYKPKE